MNMMFHNGSGERRYKVNTTKCPEYTSALEQQIYANNAQPEKDRSNNIDDLNDSAGYFIHHEYSIVKPVFTQAYISSF